MSNKKTHLADFEPLELQKSHLHLVFASLSEVLSDKKKIKSGDKISLYCISKNAVLPEKSKLSE